METTGVSNKVYSYDNNGNTLTVYKDGTLVASYTYGLFGTQDSYTNNAVQYTYYTYRPDGLRHSIGNTIHLWDGENIVADVEGNSITLYIRGINLIYADDGSKTYYHFNAHGDVVVLTNASGTKTKTYSYNAFGTEYNPGTYDTNPFRYCGEYYDTVSGPIYLRARYYNSELGRFTQQDGWEFANPEDPLSLNLYTYCWSNPVMYVDSNGHFVIATTTVAIIAITTVISGIDMGVSAKMCGQSFWKGFAAGAISGAIVGILSSIPFLSSFALAFRAGGTALTSILNELFQNGNLDNMNLGIFINDIALDVIYSMLFLGSISNISNEVVKIAVGSTVDGVVDVIETGLLYTPEAQERIQAM